MTGYDDLIRVAVVVWKHLASRNNTFFLSKGRARHNHQSGVLFTFLIRKPKTETWLVALGRTRDADNALNSQKVWLYVNRCKLWMY